jgi:hypothetical protein
MIQSPYYTRLSFTTYGKVHSLVLSTPPSHRSNGETPEGHHPQGSDSDVSPSDVTVFNVQGFEVLVSVRVTAVPAVGIGVWVVDVSSGGGEEIREVRSACLAGRGLQDAEFAVFATYLYVPVDKEDLSSQNVRPGVWVRGGGLRAKSVIA